MICLAFTAGWKHTHALQQVSW